MVIPKPFPNIKKVSQASNTAFVLFGSRFFADQTVVELLSELISVAFSDKWIGFKGPISDPIPSLHDLKDWAYANEVKLHYNPPIKLSLKLFALLCTSPLDSRHRVHENQYNNLMQRFTQKVGPSPESPEEVKEWVEDFLMGFQGAGFDRTWCAQTFYPITTNFLLQETIWKRSYTKNKELDWNEVRNNIFSYFNTRQHIFLARGGELLYLQLCNLFSKRGRDIGSLASKLGLSKEENTLEFLHQALLTGLKKLKTEQFAALNKLTDYIETLDPETNWATNKGNQSKENMLTCEWCPEESWPEAYLFAVEINHVLQATLDPIERLELLQIGCVVQVMRSLCAQSLRYADITLPKNKGSILGYAWLFSPLDGYTRQQRLASCYNLQVLFKLIQRALRNEDLLEIAAQNRKNKKMSSLLREADNKYGHKYFNLMGKRLGIIYPWKGAEPRFILTDKFLRYLVLSVLAPGESCEYHEFKHRIYQHFGIAVEGEELLDAVVWSGLPANSSVQPDSGSWLTQMLRAGGFLIELSDGCSIIENPFGPQVQKGVEIS